MRVFRLVDRFCVEFFLSLISLFICFGDSKEQITTNVCDGRFKGSAKITDK